MVSSSRGQTACHKGKVCLSDRRHEGMPRDEEGKGRERAEGSGARSVSETPRKSPQQYRPQAVTLKGRSTHEDRSLQQRRPGRHIIIAEEPRSGYRQQSREINRLTTSSTVVSRRSSTTRFWGDPFSRILFSYPLFPLLSILSLASRCCGSASLGPVSAYPSSSI